jgi:hypothetical protein
MHALAAVLEAARVGRLTRDQHVLFRLGGLVACTECAAALARRAAGKAEGLLDPRTSDRFDAAGIAAVSRVSARLAARAVVDEGIGWVVASGNLDATAIAALEAASNAAAVRAAQRGLISDMQMVADAIYARVNR